ncbi:MAG TPA: putative aminohydrolase SsnA [Anaerolineae bacterium]
MLITHGTLVTMTTPNAVITDGAVLIANGFITDIGTTSELAARHPDAASHSSDVIDAAGQLILPGNICAHTHFYGAFARGMSIPGEPATNFVEILERLWWKLDRALDSEAVRYSALVCLVDAIKHGTTTLIDHHASPNAIDGSLDVIAQTVETAGLRTALCYEVTDRNGIAGAQAGIAENTRFAHSLTHRGTGRIQAAFGLHALLTIGDDTLDRSVKAAHEAGLPLHLHVAEGLADESESVARYHQRVVERLVSHDALNESTLCAHCIHVDTNEIALLAQHRTMVMHQPRSNMNNAVGLSPVLPMLDAGICVGLGNDGFSNNAFVEMKFADLLQRHQSADPRTMGADKVINMAYANNARIASLFWDKPVGTIAIGAHADIILADYQPFTPLLAGNVPWHILFGMDGSEITHTICAGELLMRDRQLVTLDEREISRHAIKVAAQVWERVQAMA